MRILRRIIGIGAAAVTAGALVACGSDDAGTAASTSTAARPANSAAATPTAPKGRECTADDIGVDGGFGTAPTITLPDDCDPPKQLITKDLVPGTGTGPGAQPGQQLTMNYTLITWSNKKKLDSSFDRNEPFPLTLGAGQVIEGWDTGLVGVQQGARRLLIVPPDLGYGQGGRGIAPNETLVFVTDAVKIGS